MKLTNQDPDEEVQGDEPVLQSQHGRTIQLVFRGGRLHDGAHERNDWNSAFGLHQDFLRYVNR